MRIGDLNSNSYQAFLKMFSSRGNKNIILQKNSMSNAGKQTNPYSVQGMNVTGNKDWKRIIDISDEIREKVTALANKEYFANNGMSDGEELSKIVKSYINTLPKEERASAVWTIEQLFVDESKRIGNAVRLNNPGWKPGQPFDHGSVEKILESNEVLNKRV